MVELHSSNFRVITTNVLGVRIFRKFTAFDRDPLMFPSYYNDKSNMEPLKSASADRGNIKMAAWKDL